MRVRPDGAHRIARRARPPRSDLRVAAREPLPHRAAARRQDVRARPSSRPRSSTREGLAAAEYLLFYDGADNACTPTASINAGGTWAALGAPEIAKRKVAYARAISADTLRRADELVAAWDPAQGNFVGDDDDRGLEAGRSRRSRWPSTPSATRSSTSTTRSRTMKVAKPAGLAPGCAAPPCVADVESPWAKRSKEHIKNNLVGFDRLLRGCGPDGSGLGWDDLLVAVGDAAFAQKVVDALGAVNARARGAPAAVVRGGHRRRTCPACSASTTPFAPSSRS